MPKQLINIGSNPNDGTGDTLRQGADKVNDNFNEIYSVIGVGNTLNAPQSIGYADVAGVATAAQGITGSPNITVGLCSATTLTGDLTGNVTGNLTGYASTSGVSTVSQGLTGSPDISVGNIVGTSATFTGIVTASQLDGQLNSSNLTGQLPVLDGSNLTNVIATGSGVDIYDDGNIVGTAVTINLGTNIKATPVVAGITTLNSEQFSHTDVGIHTLANVGVGTTNPTYQLTVGGSGANFISSTRYNNQPLNLNDNAWVSSSSTGDIVTFQINTGSDAASDFGSFVFRTTDPGFPSLTQDALRIYSAGDSPDRLVKVYRSLEVGNNASVQNVLYIGSNNSGELSQFNTDFKLRSSTGNIRIEPVISGSVIFQDDQQRQMARFYPGGSCELYHGYNKKFETTANGVSIAGTITANTFLGDGSQLTGIDASALKSGGNIKVQAVAGGANITGDLGVSGNVSIAGTLTYEDVKNIDVIGVATFRDSIEINQDGSTSDPNVVKVKGESHFSGDVNSSGHWSHYGLLDISGQQGIQFEEGGVANSDMFINNDSSSSYIKTDNDQGLKLRSDKGYISDEDINIDYITWGDTDTSVQLYHNNNLRFQTTNGGAVLTGILTATTFIGSLTGNVTGDLTGDVTGNADTATKVYVNEYTNDSTNRPLVFAYTTTTANSAYRDLGKDHQHLYWNGASNSLVAPWFVGGLNGNASTATDAGNSSLLEGFPLETISWGHDKVHGTYTNFNTFTNSNLFGAHFVQGTTNGPGQSGATQYYHQRLSLGSNYDNYALQLAIGRNRTDNYLWYRCEENGSQGSWYKMRAGYADSAGSATTSSSCSGNSATATVASSCSGNSATATLATNANNSYACSGNAATATSATSASTATTATNSNTSLIRTDSGNAWHSLVFVDSTTDNLNQTLKMDDESGRLAWNPNTEMLLANTLASYAMFTWSGSSGTAGQALLSGGSGGAWYWGNVGAEGISTTANFNTNGGDNSGLSSASTLVFGTSIGQKFGYQYYSGNQFVHLRTSNNSNYNYGALRIRSDRGQTGGSQPIYAVDSGSSITMAQYDGDVMLCSQTGNFNIGESQGGTTNAGWHFDVSGMAKCCVDSGSSNPNNKMYRQSSGDALQFIDRAGAWDVEIGSVYMNTSSNTTTYNTTSDYRLKENVVNITGALEKINQLRPVNFNMIGSSEKMDGFIAHEIQSVIPYAVRGEKDAVKTVKDGVVHDDGTMEAALKLDALPTMEVPEYQQLDYSKLVGLLTASIQELSAKNDALEARIAALGG